MTKEIKKRTVLYAILLAVFSALVVLAILIYGFNIRNNYIRKIEKIIPFPIAIIDFKHWILIGDFESNAQSIRRFYENQDFAKVGVRIDFSTPDGQKRLAMREKQVLNKMVEDEAIKILAEKEGIAITDQILNDNVDKKLEEYGNRDSVQDELFRLYGWTIDDFKKKIVRPALFQEELAKVFEKKYNDSERAKKKIEDAEREIAKNRKSFSSVAENFSDGSSADTGGDLGWFKKEQIIPEIADKIFALKKGESSSILESQLGFHIVELEDRKTESGAEMVKIRQIFAAKKTFSDWLNEQMKTMKTRILSRDYVWNKDQSIVEFRQPEMKDFEQKVKNDLKESGLLVF